MVKQQQRNETTWEDIDMNGVELVANPLDDSSVENGGKPRRTCEVKTLRNRKVKYQN